MFDLSKFRVVLLVLIALVLFALPFSRVLAQCVGADCPEEAVSETDETTPLGDASVDIEDAEDLADTPPDEPLPNDDPYADAYKAIGLFIAALITSGTFVSITLERTVKPALAVLGIARPNPFWYGAIYVSAIVIGVVGALAGQINAFAVVPYPFFNQWDATALYVASGVAFGFSSFILYDLAKLRSWFGA